WVQASATATSSRFAGGQAERTSQASGVIRVLCAPEITFPTTNSCPDTTGLRPGDTVIIRIDMTNEGDIRQGDILTTISRPGTLNEPFRRSLNPGEIVVREFTTEITREDLDAKAISLDVLAEVDNGVMVDGQRQVLAQTTIECEYEVQS